MKPWFFDPEDNFLNALNAEQEYLLDLAGVRREEPYGDRRSYAYTDRAPKGDTFVLGIIYEKVSLN